MGTHSFVLVSLSSITSEKDIKLSLIYKRRDKTLFISVTN